MFVLPVLLLGPVLECVDCDTWLWLVTLGWYTCPAGACPLPPSHCRSRAWISAKGGRLLGISCQHSTMKAYILLGQSSGHGNNWRDLGNILMKMF